MNFNFKISSFPQSRTSEFLKTKIEVWEIFKVLEKRKLFKKTNGLTSGPSAKMKRFLKDLMPSIIFIPSICHKDLSLNCYRRFS